MLFNILCIVIIFFNFCASRFNVFFISFPFEYDISCLVCEWYFLTQEPYFSVKSGKVYSRVWCLLQKWLNGWEGKQRFFYKQRDQF